MLRAGEECEWQKWEYQKVIIQIIRTWEAVKGLADWLKFNDYKKHSNELNQNLI